MVASKATEKKLHVLVDGGVSFDPSVGIQGASGKYYVYDPERDTMDDSRQGEVVVMNDSIRRHNELTWEYVPYPFSKATRTKVILYTIHNIIINNYQKYDFIWLVSSVPVEDMIKNESPLVRPIVLAIQKALKEKPDMTIWFGKCEKIPRASYMTNKIGRSDPSSPNERKHRHLPRRSH